MRWNASYELHVEICVQYLILLREFLKGVYGEKIMFNVYTKCTTFDTQCGSSFKMWMF